MRKKLIG